MDGGFYTVGQVRQRLGYKGRGGMESLCAGAFDLPPDHLPFEVDRLKTFLKMAVQPKKGRSATFSEAAAELLREVETSEKPIHESGYPVLADAPAAEPPKKVENAVAAEKDGAESWGDVFLKFAASFSELQIVFFTNLAIADYGLVYLFKEMGGAAAVVYSLISIHALRMAGDRKSQNTAKTGVAAVFVLEAMAFVVHLLMFNIRVWGSVNRGEMPFSVSEDGTNSGCPFLIAISLASLLSAAAVYSVWTTLSLTEEAAYADAYETNHGIKY